MIKRTLYFGNPAYLSLNNSQLLVRLIEQEEKNESGQEKKQEVSASIPVEDIGMLILDNDRLTITHGLMQALQENNCAVLVCDKKHMPQSLLLPLEGNSIQQERYEDQLKASEPLKKNLWAQTVIQKIKNQAAVLSSLGMDSAYLHPLYKNVKSGDSTNQEAASARYYWQSLFGHLEDFNRYREGPAPNAWLNYGYAIVRATMARSIVSSGLLPTLGIFHRNRYNAFCLADDLMEPYRPVVDQLVYRMVEKFGTTTELDKEHKSMLLKLPVMDVLLEGEKSPLMIATQRTSSSLVKCYAGIQKKLILPEFSS